MRVDRSHELEESQPGAGRGGVSRAETTGVAVPEGLTLEQHRDRPARGSRQVVRWVLLGALTLILVLGLANVFGQHSLESTVESSAGSLVVDAPRTLRGGLFFQARSPSPGRGDRACDGRSRPRLARGHHVEHRRAGTRRRGESRREDRARARPRPRRRRAPPLPALPGQPDGSRPSVSGRRPLRRRAPARLHRARRLHLALMDIVARATFGFSVRALRRADRRTAGALVDAAVRSHPARDDRRPRPAGHHAERLLGDRARARGGHDRRARRRSSPTAASGSRGSARCSRASR